MKQIKLFSLILAVAMLLSLAACGTTPAKTTEPAETVTSAAQTAGNETPAKQETCTIVIKDGDSVKTTTIDLTEFADEVMLQDVITDTKYVDKFNPDVSDGDYGAFLNSIAGLNPDATKNEYIAIYTTDADSGDAAGTYAAPITVEGKTYYSANFGISSLPVKANESYLFTIGSY